MSRRYLTTARLRKLESHLGKRDLAVIRELATPRFLRGEQVARLCFTAPDQATANLRSARRALQRLVLLGVVERLPRRIGGNKSGSGSFVCHLNAAGQRIAMHRGWLPQGRSRRPSLPGRLFVDHALDVAELHARLVESARTGSVELLERAGEPACWRSYPGGQLKPDSYFRLGTGEYEDSFFIEVDRGTEAAGPLRPSSAAMSPTTAAASSSKRTASFR